MTPLAAQPQVPPTEQVSQPTYGAPQSEGQIPPVAPQYGTQTYAAGPPNDGQATAALILGILGIVICPLILSIPAIILGRQSQRRIEMSAGALGGLGMAKAGWILGIIGTAMGVIPLIFIIIIALVGAFGGMSNGGF